MNRRKFIKTITRFGFLAGTASLFYPVTQSMDALKSAETPVLPNVNDDMTDVITGNGTAQSADLPKNVKKPKLKRV